MSNEIQFAQLSLGAALTMWRVNPQVNGQIGDALVGARHSVSLVLDLLLDGEKVGELLALSMKEFAIFVRTVDQLQDQRTASHDSRSSRKEVSENGYQLKLSTFLYFRAREISIHVMPRQPDKNCLKHIHNPFPQFTSKFPSCCSCAFEK